MAKGAQLGQVFSDFGETARVRKSPALSAALKRRQKELEMQNVWM
jgi:hypothetical protein